MIDTITPSDPMQNNAEAADAVLAAAAEIVDAEARLLDAAPGAGYLAVLADQVSGTVEPVKASMHTSIHGSTDDV